MRLICVPKKIVMKNETWIQCRTDDGPPIMLRVNDIAKAWINEYGKVVIQSFGAFGEHGKVTVTIHEDDELESVLVGSPAAKLFPLKEVDG